MKFPRSRTSIALGAVLIALVAAVVVWRHVQSGAQAITPAPPPPIVAVVRAERRSLVKSLSIVAEFRPWTVTSLYAKQTGYLKSINVDYGSIVTAGEVVAILELPEQEAAYQQAEAAYQLARVDYDRILAVVRAEPGLIAAEDVDKAQAAYEEAKDARDQDAVLLSYADIIAPFNGVVTKRFVDPGALIQEGTSSGTQPIVTIADNYMLRLVVDVPEENVETIHVGTPVAVDVPATGQTIAGRVARFSYSLNSETRTMHTEIDVSNPHLALKPGMYAQASLVLAHQNDALALPTQAVSLNGSQPDVWIVDDQNRLERRVVSLGLQTPDWIQITGGLARGARVLLGDRSTLTLGQTVEPKPVNLAKV